MLREVADGSRPANLPEISSPKTMGSEQLESIDRPGTFAQTTMKCSKKSRRSEKETPRTFSALTRARSGTGGGMGDG